MGKNNGHGHGQVQSIHTFVIKWGKTRYADNEVQANHNDVDVNVDVVVDVDVDDDGNAESLKLHRLV